MNKILHLGEVDWIIDQYIFFVDQNLKNYKHDFHLNIAGHPPSEELKRVQGVKFYGRSVGEKIKSILFMVIKMHAANKIIVHGLFDKKLMIILAIFPWLGSKSSWVIWGGDLYEHKSNIKTMKGKFKEILKGLVIRRFGCFLTYIKGDFDLVREWYGAKGVWQECFMYPSNLYQPIDCESKIDFQVNILLGNSADPSNNHIDALKKLEKFANENIKIICPLSYGDLEYAKNVVDYGDEIFGNKFVALTNFMPFEEYLNVLKNVDIAVFNHQRQQGMGNIISLLGMGKKVYLRTDITSWETLNHLGIFAFDIQKFNIESMDMDLVGKNMKNIENYFSKKNLLNQWFKAIEV